ncbi:MAG: type II toxin-antitoxin system PemK/MazF family toxin [Vulcanimicrobiaceae bacterium]
MQIGKARWRTVSTTLNSRPIVARGDVWLVALDPVVGSEQAKTRPCIIVQREVANAGRTTIVVPVTNAAKQSAGIVRPLLHKGDGGLTKDSVALCRQVRVVDRLRMTKKLGTLSPEALRSVSTGLAEILDLSASG